MKTDMLDYYLPPELIAQEPAEVRSCSRLLVLDRKSSCLTDAKFEQIGNFLSPNDCLVINDTKVLPARFYAMRKTGAKLEGLFLHEAEPNIWQVLLKGVGKLKTSEVIDLLDRQKKPIYTAKLVQKMPDGRCCLHIDADKNSGAILEEIGFAPLPPYIKRNDDAKIDQLDQIRYQTVYAKKAGAVAAPTAGLHFTDELIEKLEQKGICFANVTLHVGIGTFKPIDTENVEDHRIHEEYFSVDEENAALINKSRQDGRRIIAVGTTTARTLETLARDSNVKAHSGKTGIFIAPGYKFRLVDAMITNFHLPKSTLLAMVAAFAGLDKILAAYKHAIENKYRFYSYGDAMLIV